ncbi:LexA family transcriptional regulator [Salinispirillum sp. LH 10-3-1]|uniref:LexA family transcriptional regulator n=1 Tax=Salinispirillum sp. LH 10-3-1 TaxID=2952525 RepID=A0AB38YCZ2_9GAMM
MLLALYPHLDHDTCDWLTVHAVIYQLGESSKPASEINCSLNGELFIRNHRLKLHYVFSIKIHYGFLNQAKQYKMLVSEAIPFCHTNRMKTWQDRIKEMMRKSGHTQYDLADALGLSQGGVGHKLNGRRDLSTEELVKLAQFFGVSVDYILLGTGSSSSEQRSAFRVPLLTSQEIESNSLDATAMSYLHSPVRIGLRGFAFKLRDSSMENPSGSPSYPEGCIVFADPDLAPSPGRRVIAIVNGKAAMKELIEDMGVYQLRSLNPAYGRTIDVTLDQVVATVVGKFEGE